MDLSPGLRVKRRHIRLYWSISNYLYQTIVFHQPPTSSTKRTVINSSEFANSKPKNLKKWNSINPRLPRPVEHGLVPPSTRAWRTTGHAPTFTIARTAPQLRSEKKTRGGLGPHRTLMIPWWWMLWKFESQIPSITTEKSKLWVEWKMPFNFLKRNTSLFPPKKHM